MNKRMVLSLVCMGIGGGIIALPDNNQRLISFSDDHGPSAIDALGIIIVILGYGMILQLFWRHRDGLARSSAGMFLLGLGAGLTVASVFSDFWHWWLVGCALLLFVQFTALIRIVGSAHQDDQNRKHHV